MATLNFVLLAMTVSGFFIADVGIDWLIWVEAGERAFAGGLYHWPDTPFSYRDSPLLAYV